MSAPVQLLTDAEVEAALAHLPAWRRIRHAITRTVEAPTFLGILDLVQKIGLAAEDAGHHPDMTIRWRTLELTLSTHDATGLTSKDISLAHVVDGLVTRSLSQ